MPGEPLPKDRLSSEDRINALAELIGKGRIYFDLEIYEPDKLLIMAKTWNNFLNEIPTEQLSFWFRQALQVIAYEPERGRKLTAIDVWYAFDAHRRHVRPVSDAPYVKAIQRKL